MVRAMMLLTALSDNFTHSGLWRCWHGDFYFSFCVLLAQSEELINVFLAKGLLDDDCVALFDIWISQVDDDFSRHET